MRRYFRVPWPAVLLFLLFWLVMISFILDLWPKTRPDGEWATISNAQYDFTVDYPTKWRAETYNEFGYRGAKEIKLHVYRSLIGKFFITVSYQKRINPTLEDVQEWGNILMIHGNQNLANQGEPIFQELELSESTLNGKPIIRRKYGNGNLLLEDVYIARTNDMIIITLQAEEDGFDDYLNDFEKVLESFKPLE